MSTIATRLKEIRKLNDLTQAELGMRLDVTKQAIANIETGHSKPSLELLSKLYENFNINLNWFITGKERMLIPPKFENIRSDILAEVEKMLKDKGIT